MQDNDDDANSMTSLSTMGSIGTINSDAFFEAPEYCPSIKGKIAMFERKPEENDVSIEDSSMGFIQFLNKFLMRYF